ncbi:MAG: DUF3857 domain-containing protein [Vulcanimicrobiota bacterium]
MTKTFPNILIRFLMVSLFLLVPVQAQPGSDPRLQAPATPELFPDATSVLLLDDIKFEVHPDGTHVFDEHDAIKILTKEGVEENASLVRMVNTAETKIEVLAAHTIKSDGRILKAEEPRYSPLSEGSEVYKSVQRFALTFPQVDVGDIVVFHLRTIHSPKRGGHFWGTTYVENPMPILESSFTVTVPQGVYFQTATPGHPGSQPEESTITLEGQEYRRLIWRVTEQPAFQFSPYSPKAISLLKRIEVSSFKDWAEVSAYLKEDWEAHSKYGESLALRVAGWLPTTGSVEERVATLLKNLHSSRRVASFLADEPAFNSPQSLLEEKLVSSPDAVILTSVALAAAGIPNFPIATTGVSTQSLQDELPNPEKINKIILEIPRSGKSPLWFDPDSVGFVLNTLPIATSDTAALSWDPRFKAGDGALTDLSIASAFANREEMAVEGRLEKSGRAELTVQYDRYGANALDSRQAARDIQAEGRDTRDRALQAFFRGTARAYGPRARLLSRYFELDPDSPDPFSLSFTVAVPGFAQVQDSTMLVPLPRFLSSDLRAAAKQRKRDVPLFFDQPYQKDVRIHLIFPEGSEVVEAPETISKSTPEADFVATGRIEGNEVWYVGRLTVHDPWVEGEALQRSLDTLEAATRSEDTILKVQLAPGGPEAPSAEEQEAEED